MTKSKQLDTGNKIFAVIDTNVVVSSFLKAGSIPDLIIRLCLNGEIVILYNDDLLKEYETVLNRKKFNFERKNINYFLKSVILSGIKIKSENQLITTGDPDDQFIYDLFKSSPYSNTYLIT